MGNNQSLSNQLKEFLLKWKKEQCNKKSISLKILFFMLGVLVVLLTAIPMHVWAMHAPKSQYGENGFIVILITTNSGIAFSGLANQSGLIYFLQTFMILFLLVILVFSKKWFYQILIGLASTGALFNLIDRAIPKVIVSLGEQVYTNVVLDYFSFFGKSAIFNFPDVWILTGIIGLVVINIIFTSIETIKERKKE
ncbi:MAG: signal peptidase II [Mycoplasma sp.]